MNLSLYSVTARMTCEALISAHAGLPTENLNKLCDSLVIIATMLVLPPRFNITSVFTVPCFIRLTTPHNWFRADVINFSFADVSITHEDLISALATFPGARFNACTLSLVTIAYIVMSLSSFKPTSELIAPAVMDTTLPGNIFLALVFKVEPFGFVKIASLGSEQDA